MALLQSLITKMAIRETHVQSVCRRTANNTSQQQFMLNATFAFEIISVEIAFVKIAFV